MAKKKRTKKKTKTSANVGYEAQLWQMADTLRGSMDAAEYKHVVLGLIFLKYISDAFEEQHAKLDADRDEGADPEDPDEYRALNIFWVPPEARWQHLKGQARQPTIGQLVDDAMAAVEYFLTGEKPDRGALPYQDLRILSALRNELVHRKPEAFVYVYDDPEHEYQPHRYVQYLVSRGVIEVPDPKNPPQWSAYVVCPETVRWAYNTVIEIISDFVPRLPEGSFAEVSRFLSKELRTLP